MGVLDGYCSFVSEVVFDFPLYNLIKVPSYVLARAGRLPALAPSFSRAQLYPANPQASNQNGDGSRFLGTRTSLPIFCVDF